MIAKNKNNKGFAILEILLVIVTLFFVAAIALVVLHHQKSEKQSVKPKIDLSKYLEVKEWHVYLQLPDTSSKMSYKVAATDQDDILISSDNLDKLANENKECSNANQFIHIKRSKTLPEQTENKQIGVYYYSNSARPSVSPCIGTDIAKVQQLNTKVYDLYDQLPSYKNVVINP